MLCIPEVICMSFHPFDGGMQLVHYIFSCPGGSVLLWGEQYDMLLFYVYCALLGDLEEEVLTGQ